MYLTTEVWADILATKVCKSIHKILPAIILENFKICDSNAISGYIHFVRTNTCTDSSYRHNFQIGLFVHRNKRLNLQSIYGSEKYCP